MFWLAFTLVAPVLTLPGIVYVIGLASVEGRPVPADPANFATADMTEVWQRCERSPSITMRRLDPWTFTAKFFGDNLGEHTPGEVGAWLVARDHNFKAGVRGGVHRHVAGGALVIWISRNWTAEQVAATLVRDGLCTPRRPH